MLPNKILSVLQILATMERLEKVNSFQEFVQIFSQFGNEMVEFAHLTGDRQNVRTYHFEMSSHTLRPFTLGRNVIFLINELTSSFTTSMSLFLRTHGIVPFALVIIC